MTKPKTRGSSVTAFILIGTVEGALDKVLQELRKLPGSPQAYVVTGPYDIVAELKAPTATALGDLIVTRIRNIPGVSSTLTCVVVG